MLSTQRMCELVAIVHMKRSAIETHVWVDEPYSVSVMIDVQTRENDDLLVGFDRANIIHTFPVPEGLDEASFLGFVYRCVRATWLHELDEAFYVGQHRVRDPHLSEDVRHDLRTAIEFDTPPLPVC